MRIFYKANLEGIEVRSAGWGRYKPTKPSDMRNSGEPPLNAGDPSEKVG